MIRLVKNEVIKLLKKKSFYIVSIIFILFCILTNVVYQSSFDEVVVDEVSISELEEENEQLNLNDDAELAIYVDNLTTIEVERLKDEYSSSVQEYLIDHYLYSMIYQMFESEYILNDQSLYEEYALELDQAVIRVSNEDWESFLDERIHYLEERVEETTDVEHIRYKELLDLALYRKDNQIPYDQDNYLHQALYFLEENMVEYINLQHDDNLSQEEEERLAYLDEEMTIRYYIIDHQQDILNDHNLRAVLMNFPDEFGLFILIYVIMLGGSIVSEEFSRGTIKTLLTKPFRRGTILTSKLLVVLLLIPVIMLFMSVVEILVGGIILGFDSLQVPVVLYANGSLISYSVIGYLADLLCGGLPMYLIIGVLAFMISTISLSTSAAITISFLFYFLTNVISNLALMYHFPLFKLSVSLYWDFSYLFLGEGQPYGVSLPTSFMVLAIYLSVMLCIAYFVFHKKDVKNV